MVGCQGGRNAAIQAQGGVHSLAGSGAASDPCCCLLVFCVRSHSVGSENLFPVFYERWELDLAQLFHPFADFSFSLEASHRAKAREGGARGFFESRLTLPEGFVCYVNVKSGPRQDFKLYRGARTTLVRFGLYEA